MTEGEYQTYLLEISKEIGALYTRDESFFHKYLGAFTERWETSYQAHERAITRENKLRQKALEDSRLKDKKAGPPKKNYVWYDGSPLETGDPKHGFWGPPRKERIPASPMELEVLNG